MKKKTKKILAGISLGTILATAPFYTGCASDITFNQADLDKALVNINEYLETQNNFSSEFAQNRLYNCLVDGFTSGENANFSLDVTQTGQDVTGRTFATISYSSKVYSEENTTIYEVKQEGNTIYQKIEFNPTTEKYTITNYTSDMKKQVLENQEWTFESIAMWGSMSQMYSYILNSIVGLFDNYTMDILDDGSEVFKTYRTSESNERDEIFTESFVIKFKEQKLISVQSVLLIHELSSGEFEYQNTYDWEFLYNINGINIDENLYTVNE